MPHALFIDAVPTGSNTSEQTPPGRPDRTSSTILRVNPRLLDTDRVGVEALLQSLARLETSDLEPLRDAVEKLTEPHRRIVRDLVEEELEDDNRTLRDRFVDGGRAVTLAQLARQMGRDIGETEVLAARWERQGEIISARHRGVAWYPTFQFRNGRPHPTIRLALAALPSDLTAWQRIFWFVSANGWLSGRAPEDRLDDANSVMEAARHESEILVG